MDENEQSILVVSFWTDLALVLFYSHWVSHFSPIVIRILPQAGWVKREKKMVYLHVQQNTVHFLWTCFSS